MKLSDHIKTNSKRAQRIGDAEKSGLSERLYAARMTRLARAQEKAKHLSGGEGVITERTKITRAATPPERWSVDVPAAGSFSSLPPGQYAFEASSCAAKACSATRAHLQEALA